MTEPTWDTLWIDANLATMDPAAGGDGSVRRGALATRDGRIAWVGVEDELPGDPRALAREVRSVGGAWITPGLVDCHTHAVFGGQRSGEFEARLAGTSYEDIARAGGGILSTVRATRAATEEELERTALARLGDLAADGVTTAEIKSGYDLTVEGELRMLRIARRLGERGLLEIRTTLLGLHVVPPEYGEARGDWVRAVAEVLIPRAADEGLADQVDAFLEGIAFSAEECAPVMASARRHGLGVRLHADQLEDGGGAAAAAAMGARSADHLEHVSEEGIAAMAEAGTVAVLLPGAYHTLRQTTPPPVELFRKHAVPMAVATDLNPGTAPVRSLRLAMNLACVRFGLTPTEALAGATRAAARVLGLEDRGRLEVGLRADLVVWDVEELAELCYWLGGSLVRERVLAGVGVGARDLRS